MAVFVDVCALALLDGQKFNERVFIGFIGFEAMRGRNAISAFRASLLHRKEGIQCGLRGLCPVCRRGRWRGQRHGKSQCEERQPLFDVHESSPCWF